MGGKPRISYKRTIKKQGGITPTGLHVVILSCNHLIYHYGPIDMKAVRDCQACRRRDREIKALKIRLDQLNEEKHRYIDNS